MARHGRNFNVWERRWRARSGSTCTADATCDEEEGTMRTALRLTVAMVVLVLVGTLAGPGTAQGKPKVAFIYVGPVGDAGWTYQHDQARQYLEQTLGVETKFVESVPEAAEVARIQEPVIRQGVWAVNPAAKIKAVWTRTWYDAPKEKSAAKALLDAGADIVGQHQDTPSALQAAAEANRLGIGSESNMQRFAPSAYLTGTIWDWRQIDAGIIQGLMSGQFKSEDYYGGLVDKVVSLGPFNPQIPADVQALVEQRQKAIVAGTFQIFKGPLRDQSGKVRVAAGKTMTLVEILGFNWLLQGIEGQSPTAK